jgi:hypothetical protein
VTIVQEPFSDIGELPPGLVTRMGPLKLIPNALWGAVLHPSFLLAFKIVLIGVLAAAMLGLRPYRLVAVTAAAMLTVQQAIVQGFGHHSHGTVPLLFVTYVFTMCPAGHRLAVNRSEAPSAFPTAEWALAVMAFTLLLTYTFTAADRLARSAPEIFLDHSMKYFIAQNFLLKPNALPFQSQVVGYLLGRPGINRILDTGFALVTIFELLAPLCLISRRFRYAWLSVIVPFHFSTLVTMKIFFWQNLLLICVLLLDIDPLIEKSFHFRRLPRRSLAAR